MSDKVGDAFSEWRRARAAATPGNDAPLIEAFRAGWAGRMDASGLCGEAFRAGWQASKVASYRKAWGIDETVDMSPPHGWRGEWPPRGWAPPRAWAPDGSPRPVGFHPALAAPYGRMAWPYINPRNFGEQATDPNPDVAAFPVFASIMIAGILNRPFDDARKWTVQGFGMMRTYFGDGDAWRLNMWDPRLAVPNVSTIHDHPWNFESWIISGSLVNQRYKKYAPTIFTPSHHFQSIKTGEGGGPVGEPESALLAPYHPEKYKAGDIYRQKRNEIHESFPSDGAVTLNLRTKRDGENARVFWPHGQKWVDAIPRPATAPEIWDVTRNALAKWTPANLG